MQKISAQLDGHVLALTFGEPGAYNMMDDAWLGELEEHLFAAQNDARVRAVTLIARGEGFCAGGDLIALRDGPWPEGFLHSGFARLLMRLGDFDKPIVAAVHGSAIGGGATLLLHCDFVYADPETKFQLPFVGIGIVPEFASSYLLPLHAGMRLATELALLAMPFDAQTAMRAGIVNDLEPHASLMARARKTAETLAGLPPAAVRAGKRLIRESYRDGVVKAYLAEGRALEERFASAELQEAVAAFFERRKPDFSRFD